MTVSASSESSLSQERLEQIMSRASFTTQQGVKILRICGTPYELGHQHGYLLHDRIELLVNRTLLALPAFISTLTGESFESSLELAYQGQRAAEPFLPTECRKEMEGIANGARAAGAKVTLQQILLWNTYYDQWCIYCHPYYWTPNGTSNKTKTCRSMAGSAGGCSSFSAWDEWAGGDGKLIMGKNEDNFNMPHQLENRIMVVAKPKYGYGHVFMTYPGLIGLDGGFNEAGVEMMTQLNSMIDESMEGCGIAVFTRLLLTHVSTVNGAIDVFRKHPRCTGIAYHVVDAKAKEAAIVETSSTKVCVRYPKEGTKALWQSNHSNCYPGWEGFSGDNMVADQQRVNDLEDISTIEKWQHSLRDPENDYVQAPSRFERYRELLDKYRGNITHENAQVMLSDLVDPYSNRKRDQDEPSQTNNVGCTICALYPDMQFDAPAPLGSFKARIANLWSMVAYPEMGDFWLAIQDFPAQNGGYKHFNLHELLHGNEQ